MPFTGRADLQLALDCLTLIDEAELRANPRLPLLYESGVRYRDDVCLAPKVPGSCERFLSYMQLLRERFGDCDDLAPALAAERRVRFGDAKARAVPVRIRKPGSGRSGLWHIVMIHGDGTREDPSALLGMPYPVGYQPVQPVKKVPNTASAKRAKPSWVQAIDRLVEPVKG